MEASVNRSSHLWNNPLLHCELALQNLGFTLRIDALGSHLAYLHVIHPKFIACEVLIVFIGSGSLVLSAVATNVENLKVLCDEACFCHLQSVSTGSLRTQTLTNTLGNRWCAQRGASSHKSKEVGWISSDFSSPFVKNSGAGCNAHKYRTPWTEWNKNQIIMQRKKLGCLPVDLINNSSSEIFQSIQYIFVVLQALITSNTYSTGMLHPLLTHRNVHQFQNPTQCSVFSPDWQRTIFYIIFLCNRSSLTHSFIHHLTPQTTHV